MGTGKIVFTNATIRRAASARALTVPDPKCGMCGGCGFLDYVDQDTGEILPAELCRSTPTCQRHAEKAEAWAAVAYQRMMVRMIGKE